VATLTSNELEERVGGRGRDDERGHGDGVQMCLPQLGRCGDADAGKTEERRTMGRRSWVLSCGYGSRRSGRGGGDSGRVGGARVARRQSRRICWRRAGWRGPGG
jgi:hypothetical protein